MNNKKISQFADALREKLKSEVILKASRLGITDKGVADVQEYEDSIVINGQVLDKEIKTQRAEFKDVLSKRNYNELIDEITYTWFNRFVALKFMSENGYLPVKVFSSSDSSKKEPDLLSNCLDINFMQLDKKKLIELKTSGDDEKLYKFLILSLCNHLHKIMPFLFEKIQDYTELMFPEKLLRTDSILADINNIIPKEDWTEVEIIGWLYQDYINPRKNKVFSDLKKNVKISKENIPAATQLFTPKWIVKYLVENSVGRLWLESNPNKDLQESLKYFIQQDYEKPKEKVSSPEEITILDPAMGSGHMLVYAFEVLYHIYKSQGYLESEISEKILNKNIYGLEIDNRATQLAGFALLMKARQYDKDLFDKQINLSLVSIQETPLQCPIEEKKYPELHHLWKFFYDAKNYGSILNVKGYDFDKIDEEYKAFEKSYSLTAHFERDLVKAIIKQAKIMSSKFDVVITNPPYMGSKSMNSDLTSYVKQNYPNSKSDLFAIFIEKCMDLVKENRITAMITMQSWMFLASYEKLRHYILENKLVDTLVHLGSRAFDQIGGEVVSTCAFTLRNTNPSEYDSSVFVKLTEFKSSSLKETEFFNKENHYVKKDLKKLKDLEGCPFLYDVSESTTDLLLKSQTVGEFGTPKKGLSTGNNIQFVRLWSEVSYSKLIGSNKKWIPLNKGGSVRSWYGNNEYVVNWENNGENLKSYSGSVIRNESYYFKEGLTWSMLGSSRLALRYFPEGFIFEGAGPSFFTNNNLKYILSFLNSKIADYFLHKFNPTLNINIGDIQAEPLIFPNEDSVKERIEQLAQENIDISKEEWDSRETSWDFKQNELFKHKDESNKLEIAFKNYCKYWEEKFFKLHKNEEELNQLFIDIYDLNDELDNKVPLEDITILKEESEIKDGKLKFKKEVLVKQFLSYVVGCIFGRFSPEKGGFILADQDSKVTDFDVDSNFKPDDDNIVPITDKDYFPDDIVGKIKEFIKTYFGANNITENLDFIASALKGSGSPEEKIRKYFLRDFFKEHTRTYKKKPIYWLFTSGKEQGFNALIYMHRYNKELLAKMRMDYLHVLQDKIDAKLSMIKEENKDREVLNKQMQEMKKYDELLNHIASQYIEIDLDHGFTVNYSYFKDLVENV